MSTVLDELDKEILKILQSDARTPFREIAKRLRTAEATVRFRVRRLVSKGVIIRFTALLNPVKIGFSVSGATLIKVNPMFIDSVSKYLAGIPEISYVYRSTGEYDMVAVIYAHDMTHFNDIVRNIKMFDGVNDVRVSVTTDLIKSDPAFGL